MTSLVQEKHQIRVQSTFDAFLSPETLQTYKDNLLLYHG